jgi:hypothetical protein
MKVITDIIQGGAVLTLMGPHLQEMLIAPQSALGAGRLVYHDLAVDDQHGTHELRFDGAEVLHAAGVKFYQGSEWVAYLAPVTEEYPELQDGWRRYQRAIESGEIKEDFYRDQIMARLNQEDESDVDMQ